MKKKNKFGTIEYRMPTIKEGLILLHEVGLNGETSTKEWLTKNLLKLVADMTDHLPLFITKVDMKDGEKEIKSVEELLSSCKYLDSVKDVCMEIFTEIGGGNEGN